MAARRYREPFGGRAPGRRTVLGPDAVAPAAAWFYEPAATGDTATGSGSFSFSGAGAGTIAATATGAGAFAFDGAGIGAVSLPCSGAGAFTFSGAGAAVATLPASGAGAFTFSGTCSGDVTPGAIDAAGAGAFSFSGAGVGEIVGSEVAEPGGLWRRRGRRPVLREPETWQPDPTQNPRELTPISAIGHGTFSGFTGRATGTIGTHAVGRLDGPRFDGLAAGAVGLAGAGAGGWRVDGRASGETVESPAIIALCGRLRADAEALRLELAEVVEIELPPGVDELEIVGCAR